MIVENGTGLANADSYVSLTFANGYFTARNVTAWNGSDAHKNAALIKATAFIDATYRFRGSIKNPDQSLAWPRVDVTDPEGRSLANKVPMAVMAAACEFALVGLHGDLVAAPETAAVKRKRVKAGSVETETEFAVAGGSSVDLSPSPYADRLLSGLVVNATGLSGGFVDFEGG